MYYFIVPFVAIINDDLTEEGTAGVVSGMNDARSNAIKTTAIEFYQEKYNTKKPVLIKIKDASQSYSEEIYSLFKHKFTIEIIQKPFGRPY